MPIHKPMSGRERRRFFRDWLGAARMSLVSVGLQYRLVRAACSGIDNTDSQSEAVRLLSAADLFASRQEPQADRVVPIGLRFRQLLERIISRHPSEPEHLITQRLLHVLLLWLRRSRGSYWPAKRQPADPGALYRSRGEQLYFSLCSQTEIVPEQFRLLTTGAQFIACYKELIERSTSSVAIYASGMRMSAAPRLSSIAAALLEAKKRGVSIHILHDASRGREQHWAEDVRYLRGLGIACRAWPLQTGMHRRCMIVDNTHVVAGSHGLTPHSVYRSKEISLYIVDPSMAQSLSCEFMLWWHAADGDWSPKLLLSADRKSSTLPDSADSEYGWSREKTVDCDRESAEMRWLMEYGVTPAVASAYTALGFVDPSALAPEPKRFMSYARAVGLGSPAFASYMPQRPPSSENGLFVIEALRVRLGKRGLCS